MVKVILAMLMCIVCVGCATVPSGGGRGGSFCDVAQPRRPSKAQLAVMTDEARRQDLAFNRYGAKACGWRP